MFLKPALSICLLALSPVAVFAQAQATAPATPKASPDVVAGIPVNYDEAKTGTYMLPDALKLNDGTVVRDAKTWYAKRRPEIVAMFETQQYGRAPGRPADESFEVTDKGTPAFNGKAIRKQVTIYLSKDKTAQKINLLVYLPAAAKKPVPHAAEHQLCCRTECCRRHMESKPDEVWGSEDEHEDSSSGRPRLRQTQRGRATQCRHRPSQRSYYGDVDPDYLNGFSNGIRAKYLKPGQTERAADDWGSISAWALGHESRRRLLRDRQERRCKTRGHPRRLAPGQNSHVGRSARPAFRRGDRKLLRRGRRGTQPSQFMARPSPTLQRHRDIPTSSPRTTRSTEAFLTPAPMDANMLIALVAPRPLLLQTGNTDNWSDPKGEFLAAVAAGPVYKLLGKQDLGTDVWPEAKQPIFHDLSYYMHDGGHGMVPSDWDIYVTFLKMHLHPEQ